MAKAEHFNICAISETSGLPDNVRVKPNSSLKENLKSQSAFEKILVDTIKLAIASKVRITKFDVFQLARQDTGQILQHIFITLLFSIFQNNKILFN